MARVVAQAVAKGSLATQEANLVIQIATPIVSPTRLTTPTSTATVTGTPTRGVFTPSTSNPTPRPTATNTPDIATTATVIALQTQLSAVRATQTALAQPPGLYAIVPNISVGLRAQPSPDAAIVQTVRAPDRLRVVRVNDNLWIEVESPRGESTGWIYSAFVTFEGDPKLLPPRLRYRVVTDRSDLPFVYGKVTSFGGVQGDYLLRDAKDEQSGFLWVPANTEVVVLSEGEGSDSYGSGLWYLVFLVSPSGKNEVWEGWLPKEVIQPR
jgi:hypothetical protein